MYSMHAYTKYSIHTNNTAKVSIDVEEQNQFLFLLPPPKSKNKYVTKTKKNERQMWQFLKTSSIIVWHFSCKVLFRIWLTFTFRMIVAQILSYHALLSSQSPTQSVHQTRHRTLCQCSPPEGQLFPISDPGWCIVVSDHLGATRKWRTGHLETTPLYNMSNLTVNDLWPKYDHR